MTSSPRSRLRRWGGRLLLFAFFCLAGWLAYRQAKTVDWSEVSATLRDYRATTLAGAFALAAVSYARHRVMTGQPDWIGTRIVRPRQILDRTGKTQGAAA